ncbi:helix-turn-helix protein [Anaeroplasma bactoclasticum]|jgi:transcriptional regulator with XRE-family HTH domain|uniref:Helix-turn-helix protein n=1 Tax=Anaeroplasma bactoclasticum TaxID=2088 RepID=A0A397S6Y7_9MOLU|nr:helix-turn-helix transcriptional regulator [Anaeroplasma bactoclasticum]RIA78034.1 helix-turn-helix protein [Anaeroplasma bactoclasticum]
MTDYNNLFENEEKYSKIIKYLNENPIDNLEFNPKKGYILIDYNPKVKSKNDGDTLHSLPKFFDIRFMDKLAGDKKEAIEIMEYFKKTNKGALKENLMNYLKKTDLSMEKLGKEACVSKQTISKIINGQLTPRKKTIFGLAFAFKLNLKETEELLSYGGYTFNPTDPFDVVVEGAITYGYDLEETNYILEKLNLDTFGIK